MFERYIIFVGDKHIVTTSSYKDASVLIKKRDRVELYLYREILPIELTAGNGLEKVYDFLFKEEFIKGSRVGRLNCMMIPKSLLEHLVKK